MVLEMPDVLIETTDSTRRHSILPDDSPCKNESSFYAFYLIVSLIISAVIIVILCLLEQRAETTKCHKCGRRPALIYPVNMLDHGCDNFGYSMAFGSVASHCFRLFFSRSALLSGPPWSQSLYLMLYILVIGLMFYPMFACLTTSWVFVGSILGLGYSVFWLYINFTIVIKCPNGDGSLPGETIATQIPVLICLLGLSLRYAYILVRHTVRAVQTRSPDSLIEHVERERLGTKYNVQYVKDLLLARCANKGPDIFQEERPKWHKKVRVFIRRHLYMNDPTFKYSPKVVCIFTVALICSYQFGIIILLVSYQLQKIGYLFYPNKTALNQSADDDEAYFQLRLFLHTTNISILVAFAFSSLLTLFSIFQILTNYRHNIKLMYRGIARHLPFRRDDRHPAFLLSDSLAYAGSQVAYILWGYIIVFAVLIITCMSLAYLLILPIFNLIPRDILKVVWNIVPGVLILQGVMLLQKGFSRGLLQSRESIDASGKVVSSATLALDNRKVYHNVSYFLFFFYIVLGVFGCFLTIIKGVILGVIYLARLDKCGLVSGFETWDKGYMYYVSFLHFEECHRHPVLLVFCDILLDNLPQRKNIKLRNYGAVDDELSVTNDVTYDVENVAGSASGRDSSVYYKGVCSVRWRARNRWLKAYTLIHNPSARIRDIEEDYDKLNELDHKQTDNGRITVIA